MTTQPDQLEMSMDTQPATRRRRPIAPDSVFFVVRIWWSSAQQRGGYHVLSQHATLTDAVEALRSALRGGCAIIRRRVDGRRFTLPEITAHS